MSIANETKKKMFPNGGKIISLLSFCVLSKKAQRSKRERERFCVYFHNWYACLQALDLNSTENKVNRDGNLLVTIIFKILLDEDKRET